MTSPLYTLIEMEYKKELPIEIIYRQLPTSKKGSIRSILNYMGYCKKCQKRTADTIWQAFRQFRLRMSMANDHGFYYKLECQKSQKKELTQPVRKIEDPVRVPFLEYNHTVLYDVMSRLSKKNCRWNAESFRQPFEE